jgi:diguanylate cyclase (GGDEF)-like protein
MNSEQFEKYQIFTENTIYDLSQKVIVLETKLNMFTNLLEISKYINQYIKDPNLFPIINDMLVGVFGATYSTIFIKQDEEYIEATMKIDSQSLIEEEKKLILNHKEDEFIINSNEPLYTNQNGEGVYSCLGVPVKVDNRSLGFIMIQHKEKGYFTKDHAIFLSSIANHIGVAIENNVLYKQIRESAYRDGLTEIFNKRYFFETLNNNPNLNELNYSMVMVDIDDFKAINDTYGHTYGDIILKQIAHIVKNATRSNDIVARYGGDEIIIFLNNFTDREKVQNRVEKMRKEIEEIAVPAEEDKTISVTASFGVYIKDNETLTLEEVIKKADTIMYLSKKKGKNHVTIG